jgi:hypothetical protein
MGRRLAIARPARRAPYPRPGEPIVPRLLRDLVLNGSAPPGPDPIDLLRISDLGARAWERLPWEICWRSGMLVVERVQSRLESMPDEVRSAPMPEPRVALMLGLERRTSNTLRRAIAAEEPPGPWTVGRYVGLPRFGGRALVDLLSAVERKGVASWAPAERKGVTSGAPVESRAERTRERLVSLVEQHLPLSERRLRALAEEHGFGSDVDVADLARRWVRAGNRVAYRIVQIGGTRFVVGPSQVTAARACHRLAARAIRGWGAASVPAVAAQLRRWFGAEVDATFVERLLVDVDGFRWVDRGTGWFWFGGATRPLLVRMRQLLAANPRLPPAQLAKLVQAHGRS